MRRNLRWRISQLIGRPLSALGRFIGRSRLSRWASGLRATRLVGKTLRVIGAFVEFRVWRPARRVFRRLRDVLGRREVFPWLLTWGICALLGWTILLPVVFLKLLGGSLVAAAFLLIALKSPLAGVLIWILTSPLLNVLIRFKFVEGMPVITGDKVCIAVLVLAFLVYVTRRGKVQPTPMLHILMAAFIGAMLLAVLPTEMPRRTVQVVLESYFVPILAYLFARRWFTDKRSLNMLFVVLLCVGVYFSLLAIPEHFTGRNMFTFTGTSAFVEEELGTVRVQGPAESPQEFGLILATVLMIGLVKLAWEKDQRKRALYLVIVGLALIGIALTLRRSVYLGAVMGLLVLLLGSAKTRRITAAMLIIGCVVGFANWARLSSSKTYTLRLGDVKPLYSRMVVQSTAWNIVKHHPLLGVGIDRFGEVKHGLITSPVGISPQYGALLRSPHNSYLRIMVEGGMLAFVPFALMILAMLRVSYLASRSARGPGLMGRDAFVVFWGFSLGLLAQAASTDSFHYSHYLMTVWFLMFGALVGVFLRPQSPEVEPEENLTKKTVRFPLRGVPNVRRTASP